MSTGSVVGSNSQAGVVLPDKTKAVGSAVVAIPDDGTPQEVNPPDGYDSAVIYNTSTLWVRARIVFNTGITGNAIAADQVLLAAPKSYVGVEFGNTPGEVAGKVDAIDKIVFDSVELPTATIDVADITALSSGATAIVVVNFASA